jgi:hypothetical protein
MGYITVLFTEHQKVGRDAFDVELVSFSAGQEAYNSNGFVVTLKAANHDIDLVHYFTQTVLDRIIYSDAQAIREAIKRFDDLMSKWVNSEESNV